MRQSNTSSVIAASFIFASLTVAGVGASLSGLTGCRSAGGEDHPIGQEAGPTHATDDTSSGGDSHPHPSVTYHQNVRAIIETNCVGCHQDDGIAPFTLDYRASEWANGPAWWAQPAVEAVERGTMPPWMPADDCKPLHGVRGLTESEKETLHAWHEGGWPEGDISTYQPATTNAGASLEDTLGAADATLSLGEGYTPDPSQPDDYRCFVMDYAFDTKSFVTTTKVIPDQTALVHHVIAYLVPAEEADAVRAFQDEDATPGYACFGGPGAAATNLGGWVPGAVDRVAADDAAFVVPAGSVIVLQMHYNTVGMGTDVPADRTSLQLWLQDTPPTWAIKVLPFADLALEIEPDDPQSIHEREYVFPSDTRLIGVTPHMHTLGTKIGAELLRQDADPSDAECLVDIPSWDFNWQQSYMFADGEEVDVKRGDRWRLTCVYDNTAGNQPTVNGEKLEPRMVTWGEGTLDEMCLTYGIILEPYAEEAATLDCTVVGECLAGCEVDDGACAMRCTTETTGDCVQCATLGMSECGAARCPIEGLAVQACLTECGADAVACFSPCQLELETFIACSAPYVVAGECDDSMACDVMPTEVSQ